MNFGDVLTRAWKITWKYKVLWVFGLLASCGANHGGSNSGGNWQTSAGGQLPARMEQMMTAVTHWMEWLLGHPAVIMAGLGLLLLLSIAAWLLGLIGIGGLVSGVAQADEDPEAELTLSALWPAALRPFARLLGLSLINWLVIALTLLVFFGPGAVAMVAGATSEQDGLMLGGMALFCGGFLAWLAVALVWNVIYLFARFAVVLEEAQVLRSLSRGWQVFWSNLGEIVVLGLILAVTRLAVMVLAIFPWLPALIATFRWMNGADLPLLTTLLINTAIALPLGWFIIAVYETFHIGAWTLAYRDVTRPPTPSAAAEAELIVSLDDGSPDAKAA